jgi:GDP-L-fucose synthase
VLPALIHKAHVAKLSGASSLEIWGTGTPRREFLHVDDLADACVFLMKHYSGDAHVNVGSGVDLPIVELAEKVMAAVGFSGALRKDETKPDGTPRKLLDSSKLLAMGWRPAIGLDEGIAATYQWFLASQTRAAAIGT